MYNYRKITDDLYWVGGNDRRLELFENIFPLSNGVSYNSYLLMDEKTVLLDTADAAIGRQFLENVAAALDGRSLDYLVVNHMEPDHCALIEELLLRYPNLQIIGNAKTFPLISQFYDTDLEGKTITVKEGESMNFGKHTLHFVMAPMVHWPEAMMTYDETDRILFSADAFGTFGALNGNLFSDEINFDRDWLDEARRYYTNIVGKYGMQVQNVLKKAASLDIRMICSLHGPIWRENLSYIPVSYTHLDVYKRQAQHHIGGHILHAQVCEHHIHILFRLKQLQLQFFLCRRALLPACLLHGLQNQVHGSQRRFNLVRPQTVVILHLLAAYAHSGLQRYFLLVQP